MSTKTTYGGSNLRDWIDAEPYIRENYENDLAEEVCKNPAAWDVFCEAWSDVEINQDCMAASDKLWRIVQFIQDHDNDELDLAEALRDRVSDAIESLKTEMDNLYSGIDFIDDTDDEEAIAKAERKDA